MAKQMIADLRPGEPVDSDFMVQQSNLRTTRTGSAYLDITLMDRSGQITCRLWDATESLADTIKVDDFVHVKGKVETYKNEPQISIRAITQAETDGLRLSDFLPQSENDPGRMMKELCKILGTIEDPDLKALADAFLGDDALCAAFRTAPAAKANHHAYLGGLLEHTLSMAQLALSVLDHYPELRRDLLLTGVFIHDIGKTRELLYKRTFRYGTAGNLVGHIVLGVLMIEECARKLPEFPEDKLNMLRHMILSHHGQYEFGSPKLPMFAEALALHYLDNLDAKLKDMAGIIANDKGGDAEWTTRSWLFERPLYKG